MSNPTRREFLRYVSLGSIALLPLERTDPSLVLYNANILTVSIHQPRAQALAIADGRFLAVGTHEEVLPLATAFSRKIDLEGKTVVPGFIDSHCHPASSGRMHLRAVDCDLRSIAAIQAAIRERAAKTPAGQWVLGFKYDDTKTSDGRWLTREDLDAAAPNHPVVIRHRGGHTTYVNSLALKLAGVDEKTPDPSGGKFDRDPATGRLTGRAAEKATAAFQKIFSATSPPRNTVQCSMRKRGLCRGCSCWRRS